MVKEGGSLPLVLDYRTGPRLFTGMPVFLQFILLRSVFKSEMERGLTLLLYFLYSFANILNPWFSTAGRSSSSTLLSTPASSKEKGSRCLFSLVKEQVTPQIHIVHIQLFGQILLAQLVLNGIFLMHCANHRECSKDYHPDHYHT